MAKQPVETPKPVADATNGLAAFNQFSMDTLVRGYQSWMDGASEINREVINFVGTRLRRDAEYAEKLARCTNWNDATQVHQSWLKQATEEYAAETGKLVEVATKVTADGLKPLKENADQLFKTTNGAAAD